MSHYCVPFYYVMNMANISNYSRDTLIGKHKNQQFLRRSDRTTDNSISLEFEVVPCAKTLALQSKTFASNYRVHGYLNLSKIIRVKEEDVETTLQNLYIYSYLKVLHNGFFNDQLNEDSDQGMCFKGHSEFYFILRSTGMRIFKDDVFISSLINLGTKSSRRKIFALLVKQFPQMASYASFSDSYGLQPFLIPDFEKLFNFLSDDYYSKRAQGEPDSKRGGRSDHSHSLGKIQICNVTELSSKEIISENAYPIWNAFTNKKGDDLFFTAVNNNHELKDNRSFFFSQANFIRLSDNCDHELLSDRYYQKMKLGEQEQFFVASEVFTNTGIKCLNVASLKDKTFGVYIGSATIERISSFLDEQSDELLSIQNIIKSIEDFIAKFEDTEFPK